MKPTPITIMMNTQFTQQFICHVIPEKAEINDEEIYCKAELLYPFVADMATTSYRDWVQSLYLKASEDPVYGDSDFDLILDQDGHLALNENLIGEELKNAPNKLLREIAYTLVYEGLDYAGAKVHEISNELLSKYQALSNARGWMESVMFHDLIEESKDYESWIATTIAKPGMKKGCSYRHFHVNEDGTIDMNQEGDESGPLWLSPKAAAGIILALKYDRGGQLAMNIEISLHSEFCGSVEQQGLIEL